MGIKLENLSQVFLDTAPFIYYFEENPDYIEVMTDFWEQVYQYGISVITSIITYVELLTLPEKEGDSQLAARYRESLTNSDHIAVYPLNLLVADKTVKYRAEFNLKTPDAIQLATAEVCGAEMILTNDSEWKKTKKPTIRLVSEFINKS